MKYIGLFLARILLAVNGIAALLLLFSAYSSYLNAHAFPISSSTGLLFPIFLVVNLLFLVVWLVIYRKYALFSLLVLLLCAGPSRTYFPISLWNSSAPEDAVKILSYNTRAFGNKEQHTREKPNPVLKYLQECDADIICLQEYIWGEKLKKKDIDYALRAYRYKHYHPLANGWNGLGVYSRYPILSAKPIKYESQSNGSIAYRIKIGDDTLLVVNNHLESNRIVDKDVEIYRDMIDAPESRKLLAGAKVLLRKMAEATAVRAGQVEAVRSHIQDFKGTGIVVCGDFNDTPISYSYRILAENLQDAFVEAGSGLGISYNLHRMPFRIDHILLSKNLKVHDCEVDRSTKASDHYPIWCSISWNK